MVNLIVWEIDLIEKTDILYSSVTVVEVFTVYHLRFAFYVTRDMNLRSGMSDNGFRTGMLINSKSEIIYPH